jgi:hypothetical protein
MAIPAFPAATAARPDALPRPASRLIDAMVRLGVALLVAVVLLALGGTAEANSNPAAPSGNTLRDVPLGPGSCGGCHGTAGVVAVSIAGPGGVLPGQTGRYTVRISGITNPAARAGFNAAVTNTGNSATQPVFQHVDFGNGLKEPSGPTDGGRQAVTIKFFGEPRTPTAGAVDYLIDLAMPATATLDASYQLYVVGNAGVGGTQVGWNHGSTITIKAAPPTPTSLAANQAAATASSIPLTWSGTQGEHFRVIRKIGSVPTSPTDGVLVYEGGLGAATASGLATGTTYFFAVYGKAPTAAVYSAAAVTTTASTLAATPVSLLATTGSSTEINLSWSGTSAEYRVLGKAGGYPTSPTDAGAKLVYQGSATNAVDAALAAGTPYFYRVWGKVAGAAVYSASFAQATASTAINPVERHVDAIAGNNQGGSNTCASAAAPCRTITQAMAMSGGGDVLSIRPGVYGTSLGEVFPISMKPGVQLVATGEPQQTVIDGSGDPVGMGLLRLESNTSNAARIEGLTLRNALKIDQGSVGAALYVAGGAGTLTVTRCIFRNNEARGTSASEELGTPTQFAWAGAIFVFSHTVHLVNNLFIGNRARGGNGEDSAGTGGAGAHAHGGAVYHPASGSVVNNTFVGNQAIGGNGGTGGTPGFGGSADSGALYVGSALVDNNIFFGNAAVAGAGPAEDVTANGAVGFFGGDAANLHNNLFFANTENGIASSSDSVGLGAGSVRADPRFHQATTDLRLRNSSPAVGAALAASAASTDFDGNPRPAARSIGAFEAFFVSQAISFGPAPVVNVGGSAGIVATGGGSGNPLTFASQTPATCSVAGATVTGVASGTCTIVANQSGGVDHTAAPQASLSFQVLAGPVFALTVDRGGSGVGSVTSMPAGINCGGTCVASFPGGTSVTLTAAAASGSMFTGWSGNCTGSGTCTVTMSAARSVTAGFALDASVVFANGFE